MNLMKVEPQKPDRICTEKEPLFVYDFEKKILFHSNGMMSDVNFDDLRKNFIQLHHGSDAFRLRNWESDGKKYDCYLGKYEHLVCNSSPPIMFEHEMFDYVRVGYWSVKLSDTCSKAYHPDHFDLLFQLKGKS